MDAVKFGGFESGDTIEAFAVGGTWSVQAGTKRTGDYGLRVNPTGAGIGYNGFMKMGADGKPTPFNFDPIYYTFYYRYATKPTSNYEEIAYFVDINDVAMFYLCQGSGGNLIALNGAGALLDVGAIVLDQDAFYRIEIKLWYAAGLYEVKINGAVDMDGFPAYLGINVPGAIYLGKRFNHGNNTVDFFYDDFCVASDVYPGAGQVFRMDANGDGHYTAWTGDWLDVDEIPHDSDTSFIATSTYLAAETVTLESAAAAGLVGTPLAVEAYAVARCSLGLTINLQMRLRSGTTDSDTTNAIVGLGYTPLAAVYNADPDDAGAWTEAKLDALEVGIEYNAFGAAGRCTSLCVMVWETGAEEGEVHEGSASLAGAGALAVAAVAQVVGVASLVGDGALAATAGRIQPAVASLAGMGTLTTTARNMCYAAAGLNGEGTLVAAAVATYSAQGHVAGAGSLGVAAALQTVGAASLSGESALAAAAQNYKKGVAVLVGEGALSVACVCTLVGVAPLAGEGTLSIASVVTLVGAATLSGNSAMVATASPIFIGTVSIAGEGTLQAAIVGMLVGAGSLQGQGSLTVGALNYCLASASLAGEGALSTIAKCYVPGAASVSGAGSLGAVARVTLVGVASLLGEGDFTVGAYMVLVGRAALSGEGTVAPILIGVVVGAASLSGWSTLTVNGWIVDAAVVPIGYATAPSVVPARASVR